MTLQEIIQTLETLSPEEQDILLEVLHQKRNSTQKSSLIHSLRGKYADVTSSSDDFAQRKQQEIF
ncbi:MAG: hypothetical protein ACLFTJ_09455 [Halothece sp.]